MKRNLNEVRQSLAKRRAMKLRSIRNSLIDRPLNNMKQSPTKPKTNKKVQETPLFIKQIIFSGFIFLAITLLLQFTPETSKIRAWVANQLGEDFPFATVSVWYQEQFGHPLGFFVDDSAVPVTSQKAVPVSGVINDSYELNGKGVIIEATNNSDVYAINQGTVLFAGKDRSTGKTVVIQHPDRTKSTYGFLEEIKVRPYQFVQASQQIGIASHTETGGANLYFSLQKGNQHLDPLEVITVNDLE